MKKRIFMLAVLILSGLQFAVAAIDEQLRALITASDDIEVTEVTNDEANPWKVENGMASTTHGKTTTNVTATITIKFRAKGYITFQYSDTFDPWTTDDYKIVKLDDVTYANNYDKHTTPTTFTHYISLEEGEHVLTFSHWHRNSTTGNYSQVLSIGNIRLETIESMYKTIHLSAPGTLGVEALSHVNTLPEMRALRLSGKMNASDWNDISKMTGLMAIDMTNADIETIPASAFTNTAIRFVDLPTKLKTIGDNAIISATVLCHQFCKIGGYVMIQGGCRFSQDIPPYIIAGKEPTKYCGVNLVGLRRHGFSNELIDLIHNAYRLIYSEGIIADGLKKVQSELQVTPEIQYIIDFISTSKRGIIR